MMSQGLPGAETTGRNCSRTVYVEHLDASCVSKGPNVSVMPISQSHNLISTLKYLVSRYTVSGMLGFSRFNGSRTL